jgi:hypothetical protein
MPTSYKRTFCQNVYVGEVDVEIDMNDILTEDLVDALVDREDFYPEDYGDKFRWLVNIADYPTKCLIEEMRRAVYRGENTNELVRKFLNQIGFVA